MVKKSLKAYAVSDYELMEVGVGWGFGGTRASLPVKFELIT